MPAGRVGVMSKPEAAAAIPPLATAILAQTPVGYWKLNETSGSTAIDYSGNSRDGTYTGAVTLAAVVGPDGDSYPTFAAGGYVTIPDNAAWSIPSTGLTIFVLNKTTTHGDRQLVGKGVDGTREWFVLQGFGAAAGGSQFRFVTSRPATSGASVAVRETVGPGIIFNEWNANAASIVNTGTATPGYLYRNSHAQITNTLFSNTGAASDQAGALNIGGYAGSLTYLGQICHVAIFPRILTVAQMKTIMDAARNEGWFTPPEDQFPTENITLLPGLTVTDAPVIDVLTPEGGDYTETIVTSSLTVTDAPVIDVLTPEGGDYTETITLLPGLTVTDAAVTTIPTLPAAIVGLTPVGYWPLDDAVSPPQDRSGNARHASATTNVTYNSVFGGGPGVYPTIPINGQIPVADNAVWTPGAGGMTVFFIARPTTLGTSNVFVSKLNASNYEWVIEQGASGVLQAAITSSTGVYIRSSASPASTVVANVWQAYCVTISGNTNAATITLYKNGNTAIPGSTTATAGAGTVANGTALLGLGYRQDLPNTFSLTGSLAHVAIFTGVLSGANIATIMNAADADGWF